MPARVKMKISVPTRMAKAAAEGALINVGIDLLHHSRAQVPVLTGALYRSGYAGPVKWDGLKAKLPVGYTVHYALLQHEALHFKHPRGGKAKYLEDPFNEHVHRYINMIGSRIGDALSINI